MVTKDEPENIAKLRREVDKLEAEKQEREEMQRTEAESLALKKKKAQLEFQKTNLYKWEKGAVDTGKKAFGWLAQKGEELTRPKPAQTQPASHPVLKPALDLQHQSINHPVRQQVQQVAQPSPMFNLGNIFGNPQPVSYAPSVRAKMQIKRKTKLKRKIGKGYRKAKRYPTRTIPRIRRSPRMPRSPTVTSQPKAFDINDVLRGMPQ